MSRIQSGVVFALLLLVAAPSWGQITVGASPDGPAWQPFSEAVAGAAESQRLMLIDVFAPWCTYCHKMQHEVYTDPALKAYLAKHFEIGRLDLSVTDDAISFRGTTLSSMELAGEMGVWATPTTVFLEPDGAFIIRVSGYQPADELGLVLRYIATEAFREQSYEDFIAAGANR